MKKDVWKIMFKLSFLPYILVILYAIYCAIFGVGFFFSTSIGMDGFFVGLLGAFFAFVLAIPIIPVCLLYQIFYLIRKKSKHVKKVSGKKYIIICGIILLVIVGAILFNSHKYSIETFFERMDARRMIRKTDEQIQFSSKGKDSPTFKLKGYYGSYILIDYDNMKVGFIVESDLDRYYETKLRKVTDKELGYIRIKSEYSMQAKVPLQAPGSELTTYYANESLSHRTRAIILTTENGEIYIAEVDDWFTTLHWSKYETIE